MATIEQAGPSSGIRSPFIGRRASTPAVEQDVIDCLLKEHGISEENRSLLYTLLDTYSLIIAPRVAEEGNSGFYEELLGNSQRELEESQKKNNKLVEDNSKLQIELEKEKRLLAEAQGRVQQLQIEVTTWEEQETKAQELAKKFAKEKEKSDKRHKEETERLNAELLAEQEKGQDQESRFKSTLAKQQKEIIAARSEKERLVEEVHKVKVLVKKLGQLCGIPEETGTEILEPRNLDKITAHVKEVLERQNQETSDVCRSADDQENLQQLGNLLNQVQDCMSAIYVAPTSSPSSSTSSTGVPPTMLIAAPATAPTGRSRSTSQQDPHTTPSTSPNCENQAGTTSFPTLANPLVAPTGHQELFVTIPSTDPRDVKLFLNAPTPPLPRNSEVEEPRRPPLNMPSSSSARDSNRNDNRSPPSSPSPDVKLLEMKLHDGRATPPVPRLASGGDDTTRPPITRRKPSLEGHGPPEKDPVILKDEKLFDGRETPPIPRSTPGCNNATHPPKARRKPSSEGQGPLDGSPGMPKERKKLFDGRATPPIPRQHNPPCEGYQGGAPPPNETGGTPNNISSVSTSNQPSSTKEKRFNITISPRSPPKEQPQTVDLTSSMTDIDLDPVSPTLQSPPASGPSIIMPTNSAPPTTAAPVNTDTKSTKKKRSSGSSRLYKQCTPFVQDGQEHRIDINASPQVHRCVCSKTYIHKNGVLAHVRRMTQEWRYKCDACEQYFFYEYELTKHCREKHGVQSLSTSKNSAAGNSNKLNRKEIRKLQQKFYRRKKHVPWSKSTVQGFWCCSCGSKFKHKQTLTEHIHRFTLDWKFRCEYCIGTENYFFQLHALKRHLSKEHEIEDPLSEYCMGCHLCGEKFLSRADFHHHRRNVHGLSSPSKTSRARVKKRGTKRVFSSQDAGEPVPSTSRPVLDEVTIVYEARNEVEIIEEVSPSSKPTQQGFRTGSEESCRKKLKL